MAEEENAAILQFGKLFPEDTSFLANDDVYCLLSQRKNLNETGQKTLDYLEKVVTTKDAIALVTISRELDTQLESLELEVERTRKRSKLHNFEKTSLRNLISEAETRAGETMTWIQSLDRFSDEEVMKAVNIVIEAKERVTEGI